MQLAGWGAFTVLSLPLKQVAFGSFRAAAILSVVQLPLAMALSTALRTFYHRIQPDRRPFVRATLLVWVACAAAGTLDAAFSSPVIRWLGITPRSDLVEPALYFFRVVIYLGWSLAYFLVKARQLAREQAFQAAIAEEKHRFEILRYQLNPEFLAKSLSAIAQAMSQDVAAAHAMTLQLAGFYQGTLRQAARGKPATVGDEVALLRTYLELERLRQHDALVGRFDLDESLLDLPLPPVLLLPLVEQAVQSGRGTAESPLEVTVAIRRNADGLVQFDIAHTHRPAGTRPPFTAAVPEVADVRAHLDRYYPGRYRFDVSRDSLQERTTLCLPLVA